MILAELSAPCPAGTSDCLALEAVRLDRAGRTMLSWRERAPSNATGSHMGLLPSGGSVLRRGQISASVGYPFRVLTAAPDKYTVLLNEWGTTWRGFLADFSTASSGEPVFSDKLTTGLVDEQVRNFTEIRGSTDVNADNELTTFTWGASPGAVNLGGGIQGYVAALPPLIGYMTTKPVRERLLPYSGSAIQWMGSNGLGQGFSIVVNRDGSGAYSGAGMMNGDPRAGIPDTPGCRNDSPGFPSVTGTSLAAYGAGVIWLESNDAGTGCDMRVGYIVLNPRLNHVRKVVSTGAWAISEQQALNDRSGPPSIFVNEYSTTQRIWSGFTKASQLPVSRLLGQATMSSWMAIAWQECDSMAADAACTTWLTKTQSNTTLTLKQTKLVMAAGSSAPLVSINHNGDAIVAWVEPSAPCSADATKQCAQLKAQRF